MGKDKPFRFAKRLKDIFAFGLLIGVVGSIAVPTLGLDYKERNFDNLAKKTLAEVTEAQKYHYQMYKSFIPCNEKSCAEKLTRVNYVPLGVKLTVVANESSFKAMAYHMDGTGESFVLSGSGR